MNHEDNLIELHSNVSELHRHAYKDNLTELNKSLKKLQNLLTKWRKENELRNSK